MALCVNTLHAAEIKLNNEELEFINKHPVITVGNEMDWPPFDFSQYGKPRGLSIDFIKLLAKKAGLEINFVNGYTWGELLSKLESHEIDVLPAIYKTAEREEYTLYTKPYLKGTLGIYVNKSNTTIKSIEDLVGKNVGVQGGFGEIVASKLAALGVEFVEYPQSIQLLQKLSDNMLDAVIGNPLLFSYVTQYNKIINTRFLTTIQLPEKKLDSINLYVGVRKDYPILRQILDKAIDAVSAEEMSEIREKWPYNNQGWQNLSSLPLTPEEVDYIASHPVIKVSNGSNFMPYDFTVGSEPRGYSIDLLNILAANAGLEVEYVSRRTWFELEELFNKGGLDLLHTLTKSKEREEVGIFSYPYATFQSYFFIRKGDPEVYRIEDVFGKTAVVGKGWNVTKFLKKHYPEVNLLELDSTEEMLYALSKGDADVLINGDVPTEFIKNRLGMRNIKTSGGFLEYNKDSTMSLYFFAHKNSPELISILNKASRNIDRSDFERISNKWFGESNVSNTPIVLTQEEKDFISEYPVVHLVGGKSFAPFLMYDSNGEVEGHDVDLTKLISERTGLNIDITLMNWYEAQSRAENREFDGLISASNTSARDKYYNSSDSYMQMLPLIIVKKGNPKNISQVGDLSGKRVALQRGNFFKDLLEKKCDDAEITYYDSIDDLIRAVVSEEVDFTILDQTAFYVADMLGLERMIEAPIAFDEPLKLHYQLRNDRPELVTIINKGLNSISGQERHSIRAKWFGGINQGNYNDPSISLTQDERRYLDEKGSITYVVDPNWMPFESINDDGEHIGITADYIELFSERLGTTFNLKKTKSWNETLDAMRTRDSDIVTIARETESRKDYMNFSSPFMEFPTVIVTRNDEFMVEDIGDKLDKTFAVVSGYSFIEELKIKYPEIKILEADNIFSGLKMVSDGEAFAYIDSSVSVQYALSSGGIDGLKVSGTLPGSSENTMGIRNDDPVLYNIMQKALDSISEDDHKRILNKWMAVTVNKVVDYTLFWRIVIGLLLLLFITIIWNRKLRAAKKQTEGALHELKIAQVQLVQAEKMVALGQLVAGIAHDINTPLGAIKSSGENISYSLNRAINNLPKVYDLVNEDEKDVFIRLLDSSSNYSAVLTSKDARRIIKPLIKELDSMNIENSRYFADIMLQMGIRNGMQSFLPILKHPKAEFIFETAYNVYSIAMNTNNIGNAVSRASKVIFALKSFSRSGENGDVCEVNLKDNIEAVLTLYQHLIKQGIELVRDYESISLLSCYPDELGQVWTNLIHNAIQAMDGVGQLGIKLSEENDCAVVSISDTGCGIPDDIQSKLYDPFFTTKGVGEGTGLGLDIVKKIIEKHNGTIELESEVGIGTTFTVKLPYVSKERDGSR